MDELITMTAAELSAAMAAITLISRFRKAMPLPG